MESWLIEKYEVDLPCADFRGFIFIGFRFLVLTQLSLFVVVGMVVGFVVVVFLKFWRGMLTGDLNSGYLVDLVGSEVVVKGGLVV